MQIEAKKCIQTPKQPRERKKFLEQQMAKKNSKAILSKTFDFDPEKYLDKSLLFDLKKTSEDKIFDSILEKIPNNDMYYIEHRESSNAFRIRKDRNQAEKDRIIETIENIDKKIRKSKKKSNVTELKILRKEILKRYKELDENFVEINSD